MKATWLKVTMCAIYDCIARVTTDTVLAKQPCSFGNPPSFTFCNTTEASVNYWTITYLLHFWMTYILNFRPVNQFTNWIGKAVLKKRSWIQASLKENVLDALRITGLTTACTASLPKVSIWKENKNAHNHFLPASPLYFVPLCQWGLPSLHC